MGYLNIRKSKLKPNSGFCVYPFTAQSINILIVFTFLVGCENSPYIVPVKDSEQPPSKNVSHHVVANGETLYSIAWRYDLDYKSLARSNGIRKDYTIYPGQRLRLKLAPAEGAPGHDSTPKIVRAPAHKNTVTRPTKPKYFPKKRSKKQTPRVVSPSAIPSTSSPRSWVWPVKGKFSSVDSEKDSLNKGIDIRGKLGEPVVAAAAGSVVYSGSGLRGYGKLVIVKHSAKYLSAYAHNRRLLVKEGAVVKQGQKIAEMGSTGTNHVKLHFEIRHDGKPVDPIRYLPKKY